MTNKKDFILEKIVVELVSADFRIASMGSIIKIRPSALCHVQNGRRLWHASNYFFLSVVRFRI